ncbi:stress responsive A/B barrel domain-containing protein [Cercophora newfieldiana]|uniref:Stress responsive A/B barrel domain-containing protein n=1 Tax=Cercophora newfieldiana TaxID=92897 RepID=A0AA39XTL2_9PEZI|nr:stress responsive A/B barrel domain-containing protein [Cercophora newfieldiana]
MLPKHRAAAAIFLLLVFLLYTFFNEPSLPTPYRATWRGKMSVTHTVLFQFKSDLPAAEVKAACARFLALKETCIHPTHNGNYILSLKGGKDNSPEGLQNGITHGFVVEFSSVEDRDYYVTNDPTHMAFVKSIEELVEKAIVVDFKNGEY